MISTANDGAGNKLQKLVEQLGAKAKSVFDNTDEPAVIVSPYRMNPLGAHIDHQGGSVLARTIDQYTVLAFYPSSSSRITIHSDVGNGFDKKTAFDIGDVQTNDNWVRYAMASAASVAGFTDQNNTLRGFNALVYGSLVGAGLSSSASVILAYVSALAHVNSLNFSAARLVKLVQQVENVHMGLNNGLQDQMSVVFGQSSALSLLNMSTITAEYIDNPASSSDVCWVICYSGFSRELVSSGFNERVRECREAATLLDATAKHLGEVQQALRTDEHLATLPPSLRLRAMHVYSEMQRVADGALAWQQGNWEAFGRLMNLSCDSSINQYQCGSEPMIELHQIALKETGVFGSRFGGGGYGGCLAMLVQKDKAELVRENVLSQFLQRYPEKRGIAQAFVANAENNVRLFS